MRPLSHSSVSVYLACPKRYKYRYVDKVPEAPRSYFSFGKSVHMALKFMWENVEDKGFPAVDDVLLHYKRIWIRSGYESPQQERFFYLEGKKIVERFHAKHLFQNKCAAMVEQGFEFTVCGVPVIGYIDRIDLLGENSAVIVEYKTGKEIDPARVKQDQQLTLYQLACENSLGLKVNGLVLYHLNSLTAHTSPGRSAEQIETLKQTIVKVAESIKQEKFEPLPSAPANCRDCDYKTICCDSPVIGENRDSPHFLEKMGTVPIFPNKLGTSPTPTPICRLKEKLP